MSDKFKGDTLPGNVPNGPSRRLRVSVMILVTITGLIFGALLSLWQSGRPPIFNAPATQANSAWITDPEIGSDEAGLMLRARIARRGLFALKRAEAVYYTRAVDDMGRPLDEACSYRIDGGALPANWWSITIYAEDNFLPRNGTNAHSIDASSLQKDGAIWSAIISHEKLASDDAWISTSQAGAFDLTLRLYEPDEGGFNSDAAISFPSVKRLSC